MHIKSKYNYIPTELKLIISLSSVKTSVFLIIFSTFSADVVLFIMFTVKITGANNEYLIEEICLFFSNLVFGTYSRSHRTVSSVEINEELSSYNVLS